MDGMVGGVDGTKGFMDKFPRSRWSMLPPVDGANGAKEFTVLLSIL